ncbi:MAG TPA: helix-hairpin-helix domain-containing protein, partial [Candidatus Udaeobacter sp.]|nr:helix-hairpin-helix domain-containing protein [Candidatus Udaeobacter sp.]
MDNREVARLLEEIATLLELKGENPFKSRAYQNAARAVDALEEEVAALVETGRLAGAPGIGPGITVKLTELVRTGRMAVLEDLRRDVPRGLREMVQVPGLGPKRARAIHEALGIDSLAELAQACRDDRLKDLKGFGAKTQESILAGIARRALARERRLLSEADASAAAIVEAVGRTAGINRISIAGSLRRRRETIKDIDIVVSSTNPTAVMEAFVTYGDVEGIIARGPTRSSVRLWGGIQVDLRVVTEDEYPFALLYFTGSKAHNIGMRAKAQRMGLKLNEYGLFDGETPVPCDSEPAIYQHLGYAWVAPELREDTGELLAAEEGTLPKLVAVEDLQGILHVRSTWSDGTDSIADLARAARERGFRYLGLADRARSSAPDATAVGLGPAEVAAQRQEIARVEAEVGGIQILQGLEVDILPDGRLDASDVLLGELDFVIAAARTHLDQDQETMTARLERAIAHPHTTILAHPTGRRLFEREPAAVDLNRVLGGCREHRVAIEVSGDPERLD